MTEQERKVLLLDQLHLERAADAPGIGKWISVKLLASFSAAIVIGLFLWYLTWPARVPVHIMTVASAPANTGSSLDASGYVVARRQATLSAKILGKLVAVDVEEGDRVSQGQVVARLDDANAMAALNQSKAQLSASEAGLAQAKAAFENAVPSYFRYRALLAQGAISAEALDRQKAVYDAARTGFAVAARAVLVAQAAVAAAQANEDDTVVRAPFAGVVTDKAAQPGEIVAPAAAGGGFTRTGIATIVDMDSLEIQIDVNESTIDHVHAGQGVRVWLNAYPDWEISGSVIAVVPTADQTKGSVKVRIGMQARDDRILPQMGVRVAFLSDQPAEQRGVMLPAEFVRRDGDSAIAYVVTEDGRHVEARRVILGLGRAGLVGIKSGLSPGDRVVTTNLDKLHDGADIKIEP